ncbi:MAG: hypothetical protein JXA93_06395 [Anaerolineae bacterium]|nr:hypothetical protein [Anaerolineae bacterium]
MSNETGATLTVKLQGPEDIMLTVPPGEKENYCLVAGAYSYTGSAPSYVQKTGSTTWPYEPDDCNCWWWFPDTEEESYRPCQCPIDPGRYHRPPLAAGAQPWTVEKASAHCPHANACIVYPEPGATISGRVYIMGSATLENFQRYKIEWWGQGGSGWAFLLEKTEPVVNGELMMLNTSTVPSGRYGLRLTVIDRNGNYLEPCEIWWKVR